MALIYADDFQQLKYADKSFMYGSTDTQADTDAINTGIEAMGFERPIAYYLRQGNVGNNQYYFQTPVGYYPNPTFACLAIYVRPPTSFVSEGVINSPGVNGLKRKIQQKGDTVFINFRWAFPSNFIFTASHANITFVQCGQGINLALSATGTLVFNGVDTGFGAVFDTEVPLLMEIVAGPDYVELWVGFDRVSRQVRQLVPVDYVTIGFEKATPLTGGSFVQNETIIKLYSLIIADSSGTSFNTRIGRKIVRTYEANSVTTNATLETTGGTALATIRRPVQDLGLSTGSPVYGNLYSPKPFIKTTLAGLKPVDQIARGACIHMQAKRRTPATDGMVAVPFITIGATTYTDPVGQTMRSRWTSKCTPIDIPANTTFTDFNFGYTHDYQDVEKLYVDDRAKVEVYGTKTASYVLYMPFQSAPPKTAVLTLQTPAYSAYVFDYAKSDLSVAKTPINNLTYYQDS